MKEFQNDLDWVGFYKECGHTIDEISSYLNINKEDVKILIKKYEKL